MATKKTKKEITEEEKEKCKAFLEGETGIFIIEKLTRDIIELCKLPKAIELRKIWDIITMTRNINSRKNNKTFF